MNEWEFWAPIVSEMLRQLLPVLILALVGYVTKTIIPRIAKEYNGRIDAQTRETLKFAARFAVTAAEQIAKRDDFRADAARKKAVAYERFNEFIRDLKLNITADEVEDWIEAAVGEINHEKELAELGTGGAMAVLAEPVSAAGTPSGAPFSD
jgi:hypothetical protein